MAEILKGDEKGLLVDLSTHEGFKVLIKTIDLIAQDQERQVAATKIQVGKEAEVLYAKARAEGARNLQNALVRVLTNLRKKNN